MPPESKRVVVYSEGPGDWSHLGGLVLRLAAAAPVLYLARSPEDPAFGRTEPNLSAVHVGDGIPAALLMRTLAAGVCVMTMPDLDSFHIRRSVHPVRYAYVFHCLFSTHMIYRPSAFDAYDVVLCAGPHQAAEIRARERLYGLPPKDLLEHGYGRLDAILAEDGARPRAPRPTQVLVAPTWGPSSLLEAPEGGRILASLVDAGHRVSVRPHPMTLRRRPNLRAELARRPGGQLSFDSDLGGSRSLAEADVLVTDWSGAALDFALGTGRPVLSVETPPKVNNPEFPRLGLEPVELGLRAELGAVLPLAEAGEAGAAVERLARRGPRPEEAEALRRRLVFNAGRADEAGARLILDMARGGVA